MLPLKRRCLIIFSDVLKPYQDKADHLEETTEAFEGCDYQAEVETGMASEIKIAEIVEMHCEEEFLTEEEQNVEFRAEMVDVGCDLDREVAELMRDGREGRLSIQAFLPSVLTDWREGEGQETIRLVVQDYDMAGGGGDTGGETPAELPEREMGLRPRLMLRFPSSLLGPALSSSSLLPSTASFTLHARPYAPSS